MHIDLQPHRTALQCHLDGLDHTRLLGIAQAKAVSHDIEHLARAGGRGDFALGLHLGEAAGRQPLLDLLSRRTAGQLDRKSQHDARIAGVGAAPLQLGVDGLGRVVAHRLCGLLVEQLARTREQKLQVVVQLRHRAHGGAAGAHGIGLVNSNGGRHALHLVDRWLVHAVEKLARVGAEGLHVAALAFGVQGVKHQAGFARATGAGDHGELAGADVQVQVLEVVLACTADTDQSLGHGGVFRV